MSERKTTAELCFCKNHLIEDILGTWKYVFLNNHFFANIYTACYMDILQNSNTKHSFCSFFGSNISLIVHHLSLQLSRSLLLWKKLSDIWSTNTACIIEEEVDGSTTDSHFLFWNPHFSSILAILWPFGMAWEIPGIGLRIYFSTCSNMIHVSRNNTRKRGAVLPIIQGHGTLVTISLN